MNIAIENTELAFVNFKFDTTVTFEIGACGSEYHFMGMEYFWHNFELDIRQHLVVSHDIKTLET